VPFPRKLLIENEELVLELRPHWIALVGPVAVTVLLVALWTGALVYAPDDGFLRSLTIIGGSALALFVFVFYPVRKFIAWVTSYFVVTSDRVIHREGWIAKHSMEIPLEAINDVRFNQGVFERMIGAGDLVISSASEFGRQIFGDIRDPEEVQRTISHQGELNKERMYRGGPAQAPSARSPASPSAMTELERLAQLRDDGVLTEDEFQEQKKKILGGS
jgi:uncharacterized membrane protein YdbT with pleckstrin-like domain